MEALMLNTDYFLEIDSEHKAYWLGFILADGCLSKDKKCITVALQSLDCGHLQKLADIFSTSVRRVEVFDKRTNKTYLRDVTSLCSIELWRDVHSKFGVRLKSNRENPKVFKYIPECLWSHFIRGYFDGDGFVGFSKKAQKEYQVVIVGSNPLLSFISDWFARSLHIRTAVVKKVKGQNIHRVHWGGNWQLHTIRDLLYKDATIWLERKREKFDQIPCRIKTSSSKYRGVQWLKRRNCWAARIYINGKNKWIGQYNTEEEAAKAYDDYAKEHRGYGVNGIK
jgi:hypothetical protein